MITSFLGSWWTLVGTQRAEASAPCRLVINVSKVSTVNRQPSLASKRINRHRKAIDNAFTLSSPRPDELSLISSSTHVPRTHRPTTPTYHQLLSLAITAYITHHIAHSISRASAHQHRQASSPPRPLSPSVSHKEHHEITFPQEGQEEKPVGVHHPR